MQTFEELIAWQKARELTRSIYQATRRPSFSNDRSLISQIRRASVSVMANIAEGHERTGPREFHRFLSTAKGSCAEVRSHLYVALDAGHLDRATFDVLLASANEASRVIGGLRAAISRRVQRGSNDSKDSKTDD